MTTFAPVHHFNLSLSMARDPRLENYKEYLAPFIAKLTREERAFIKKHDLYGDHNIELPVNKRFRDLASRAIATYIIMRVNNLTLYGKR